MIVCHCKVISDFVIKKCCKDGCCSLDEVSKACGACTDCKSCKKIILEIIDEEKGIT